MLNEITSTYAAGFELIGEGALHDKPELKEGFCLVCRYSPGFGLPDREVLCADQFQIDEINRKFMMAQILDVRWGQVPWAHALVRHTGRTDGATPVFYH